MDTPATTAAPSAGRDSAALTYVLLGAVVLIGAIFAFSSSDGPHWFALFKWVHVSVAVFWVGGGLLLTVLGLKAERSSDPNEVVTVARQAAFAGEKLFAPAGLVVVLMGIAMLVHGNGPLVHWGTFWVIAGLVGYASTFVVGIGVLAPLAKKVAESAERNGADHPETIALVSRILLVARFDIAVLLLVIADMVTKPFS